MITSLKIIDDEINFKFLLGKFHFRFCRRIEERSFANFNSLKMPRKTFKKMFFFVQSFVTYITRIISHHFKHAESFQKAKETFRGNLFQRSDQVEVIGKDNEERFRFEKRK